MNRDCYAKISGKVRISNENALMPIEYSTTGGNVDNMVFMHHGRKIETRNPGGAWTCDDGILINDTLGISKEYKCILDLIEQDYRRYELQ